MEPIKATLTFGKETKRTVMYEDPDGVQPIGNLYLQKRDVGKDYPKAITVTVKAS